MKYVIENLFGCVHAKNYRKDLGLQSYYKNWKGAAFWGNTVLFITSPAMPLSSTRQAKTADVAGSAADAWQSLDMLVDSVKMFQCMSHAVWQWRWGQVVNLCTGNTHVAVLTIPGPHRLNWTMDSVLASRGTWLVIVRDGGRYNLPPVKPIGEWVNEYNLVPAKSQWCCLSGKLTTDVAESNGSLLLGFKLSVTLSNLNRYAFQQCKNFENRLRFDEVTGSLRGNFFRDTVYNSHWVAVDGCETYFDWLSVVVCRSTVDTSMIRVTRTTRGWKRSSTTFTMRPANTSDNYSFMPVWRWILS